MASYNPQKKIVTAVVNSFILGLDQVDCRYIRIGAGVGGLQETLHVFQVDIFGY